MGSFEPAEGRLRRRQSWGSWEGLCAERSTLLGQLKSYYQIYSKIKALNIFTYLTPLSLKSCTQRTSEMPVLGLGGGETPSFSPEGTCYRVPAAPGPCTYDDAAELGFSSSAFARSLKTVPTWVSTL